MVTLISTILIGQASLGQFRKCTVQPQYYYQNQYYQNQYYQEPVAQFVAINEYDLVGQQERLNLSNEREAKIDQILNYINSLKSKPIENKKSIEYPQKAIEDQEDPPIKYNNYQENKENKSEAAPPIPLINEIKNSNENKIVINDAPQNIVTIFKNNCVSCHSNSANSKLNLFTVDGKPNSLTPKQLLKIEFAVHNGSMPKKGGPLSNENYSAIREWVGTYEEQILLGMK